MKRLPALGVALFFAALSPAQSASKDPIVIVEGEMAQLDIATGACAAEIAEAASMENLNGGARDTREENKINECMKNSEKKLRKTKDILKNLLRSDESKLSELRTWYVTYASVMKSMPYERGDIKEKENILKSINARIVSSLEF